MAFPTLWKFTGDLFVDVDGSIKKETLPLKLYQRMKCPTKHGFANDTLKRDFSLVFSHLVTVRDCLHPSLRYHTPGSFLYRYPGKVVVLVWGDKPADGPGSVEIAMGETPLENKKAYISIDGELKWRPISLDEVRKISQLDWVLKSPDGCTVTVIKVPVQLRAEWDQEKCPSPKDQPPLLEKKVTKTSKSKTLNSWLFSK